MTVLLRSGHIMCRSHIFDLDVFIVYFTCGVTSRGLDQWGRSACFTCHLHARKRERERKKGGGGEFGVTFPVGRTPDRTP